MNYLKRIGAAVLSVSLAATFSGCTPAIGSDTKNALSVGGYDIPAGVFIYYTIQGYNEAANVLGNQNGEQPDLKAVRSANIDSVSSTEWIQNKATEYCIDFANIQKEFDAIGGELSLQDKDDAAEMAEYYYNMNASLSENGVSLDSMKKLAENSYKEQAIFEHYYGFDSEKGCTEDELKDYFDENYARVKYISISLKDSEGEKVAPDEERKLRNMAEKYAKQINTKSGEMDKMFEMEALRKEYEEYVAAQTTTAEDETAPETTTTAVEETEETTETTTTYKYENERLMQKNTTTEAVSITIGDTETQAADGADSEESAEAKATRLFNEYIFNELPLNKAQVYEYSADEIYVILRGDLRERMTEDDYWSENYVSSLRSQRYYDQFTKELDEKADALTVSKNKSAYRRYEPFKLTLE